MPALRFAIGDSVWFVHFVRFRRCRHRGSDCDMKIGLAMMPETAADWRFNVRPTQIKSVPGVSLAGQGLDLGGF
jgi:hypothetical protein